MSTERTSQEYAFSGLTAIKRWWWVVVLSIILMVGLSYVLAKRSKPTYEAAALIALRAKTVAPQPYANHEIVRAFLSNTSVLEVISRQMDGLPPETIAGSFQVMQVNDFIKVTVTSGDYQQAIKLVNVMGTLVETKAAESGQERINNYEKRIRELAKGAREVDLAIDNQEKEIKAMLRGTDATKAEAQVLSAWQTQLISMQEDRRQRILREQMDLKNQIINTKDTVPVLYKSKTAAASKSSTRQRLLAGLIVGGILGITAAIWLEMRRKSSR